MLLVFSALWCVAVVYGQDHFDDLYDGYLNSIDVDHRNNRTNDLDVVYSSIYPYFYHPLEEPAAVPQISHQRIFLPWPTHRPPMQRNDSTVSVNGTTSSHQRPVAGEAIASIHQAINRTASQVGSSLRVGLNSTADFKDTIHQTINRTASQVGSSLYAGLNSTADIAAPSGNATESSLASSVYAINLGPYLFPFSGPAVHPGINQFAPSRHPLFL